MKQPQSCGMHQELQQELKSLASMWPAPTSDGDKAEGMNRR